MFSRGSPTISAPTSWLPRRSFALGCSRGRTGAGRSPRPPPCPPRRRSRATWRIRCCRGHPRSSPAPPSIWRCSASATAGCSRVTEAWPARSRPGCCSSPPTACWRADVTVALALTLGAITLAIALSDAGAGSLWRHAYHAPVVAASLRWGGGGVLAALAAMLLYTPFVLPALERGGPSRAVLEGLITLALLLGVGVSSGALAAGVRRQRARYQTLVAVQRAVDGQAPLDV